MTSSPLTNVAIAASAGSGKTFQLAHRFIRLLAGGVPADRICALTFSRKAAGEIFDAIVKYLVQAASTAEGARTVSRHAHVAAHGPAEFLVLLRQFLDALHRLHIGTLDSFMIGVLRAFPSELGVTPDFSVMDGDGAAATELRARVLQRLFKSSALGAGRSAFLDAYKRATFGREEKQAFSQLDDFVQSYRTSYQSLPTETAWGEVRAIWPEGTGWLNAPVDPAAVCDAMQVHAANAGWDPKVVGRWQVFIDAVRNFSPYTKWSGDVEFLFTRLAGELDALRTGAAEFDMDRKTCVLNAEGCRLALQLMQHVIGTELHTALEGTRGLYQVLAQFEIAYNEWSRRAGEISFSDAQYLLTGSSAHGDGLVLSRTSGVAGRLYIDYRLDARLDHWLLDEFQDTSDLQWAAISNLIDEILQDPTGGRSFFYVGDIKQAIYGWRGGNPRLFKQVLRTYQPRIVAEQLSTSFRSCQPVLDCVNAVFANVAATGLPAGACQRWQKDWLPHAASPDALKQTGWACLIEPPTDGKLKPTDEDRYRLAAGIVRELDPIRRDLSVALLVRQNDHGRDLVDMLRRECPGLPVVHEGHAPLNDNPVVALLMALVRFALHPGDLLAWRHLQMSPLAQDLYERAATGRLPEILLREMQETGFQDFLRRWGHKLDRRVSLDPFGRRRLHDLVAAAGEFEASGERDTRAFFRFLDEYQTQESATGQVVRVMTIHQSKGLGFDVVILPDLQGRGMDGIDRPDLITARDPKSDERLWALRMPRRVIAECDSVLCDTYTRLDEDATFEDLCVLYVALTRAKRGLYVITSFPGKTSESKTAAFMLKKQLVGDGKPLAGTPTTFGGIPATLLYQTGQRDWLPVMPTLRVETSDTEMPSALPSALPGIPERETVETAQRLVAVEPSAHESPISRPAARLFDREARDVLEFGTAIHALFEQLSWSDDGDPLRLLATPDIPRDVASQFQSCLADKAICGLLAKPAGSAVLWRELRFEIILGKDEWVRGVFDRVVVTLDDQGRPASAAIIDFKSDRVANEEQLQRAAEGYRSQLALYARAVARILELPDNKISQTLVFTRVPRVHALTASAV